MHFIRRLKLIPLFPLLLVCIISVFSLLMLYSLSGGSFFHWCFKQLCKFAVGAIGLVVAFCLKPDIWRKYAVAFYFLCLAMLVSVAIVGKITMGAQRWLNFYFVSFQPSELMRIALVVILAKYFSYITTDDVKKTSSLLIPAILTFLPMGLVLMQPDLGTAMLLFFTFCVMLFVCGMQVWKFLIALLAAVVSMPFLWHMLHEYQRQRILMFFSPEMDPSGAGYHIIQSKIALGSGGFWGRGFMNGTQGQLNFLPEKQTDFILAALGEELGFFGCLLLLMLYAILIVYNLNVAIRAKGRFEQLMVFGLNSMIFFYVFINVSMVCGLLPVVGIPLPFFSYGGSALTVLMFCQGLIFAVDAKVRQGGDTKLQIKK